MMKCIVYCFKLIKSNDIANFNIFKNSGFFLFILMQY